MCELAALYHAASDDGFDHDHKPGRQFLLTGMPLAIGILNAAKLRYGRFESEVFWMKFVYAAFILQQLHEEVPVHRWPAALEEYPESDLIRFGVMMSGVLPV